MINIRLLFNIAFLSLLFTQTFFAQNIPNKTINSYIEEYKVSQRGPYKDIRWFCVDGKTVPPNERCPEPGGRQRARYKDQVIELSKTNHVFLGQILTTTPFTEFFDAEHENSRLKQYQLEKYLRVIDNGWILRRAQFYRGAFQAEDEKEWGIKFYEWLLANDEVIRQQFYLIRESIKDIPHEAEDNKVQNIRSLSRIISDMYPPFMDIRVKIHGQPDIHDVGNVIKFKNKHKSKLTPELLAKFDELIEDMQFINRPVDLSIIETRLRKLLKDSRLKTKILSYIKLHSKKMSQSESVTTTVDLLWNIRKELLTEKKPNARLALFDLSIKLEELIFREIDLWETKNLNDLLTKNYMLSKALAATGFIEIWEWEYIEKNIMPPNRVITLGELNEYLDYGKRVVEWGTATTRVNYEDVVNLFGGFEYLSHGFIDDRIRSSLLLPLGNVISRLNRFVMKEAAFSNQIMDLEDMGDARGLNPGYALGELVVISDITNDIDFLSDKIYILNRPPADLKPVAGIATVTEGNIVSHVQLLARNLGIPNAVVSQTLLNQLKKYAGKKVFYAVSNRGTVVIKLPENMTNTEKSLFEKKKRNDEKITVPVDKLEIDKTKVVNLRALRATDSGKLCGPKAANLGELKFLFAENVVEGFVIPFGIFKQHLDQKIPGSDRTYWQFINSIFAKTNQMQREKIDQKKVDEFTLKNLEELRKYIKNIKLLPEFVLDMETQFAKIFNAPLGSVPVFLRSDTNMEDLKDFTGAGLNLTIFNVAEKEKILQGIRDVWASPYSERSYRWRQKFLLNPENVFPSILVIPSVNVDKSGVMITKGVISGNNDDITVAFSRGAGGAVEGQLAETYTLSKDKKDILLFPSRESKFNVLLENGGSSTGVCYFDNQLLKQNDLTMLRNMAANIVSKISANTNVATEGPYDIELGFKDSKIWLFQIRPFVENKNALKSEYLDSITPEFPVKKSVDLTKSF